MKFKKKVMFNEIFKKLEKRAVESPNTRFRHTKGKPNNSVRLSNASDEHYGRVNLQTMYRQDYSLFSIVGS